MSRHTPEPWIVNQYGNVNATHANPLGHSARSAVVLANGFASELGIRDGGSEGEHNRDRIVACVNACANLNPDAIPALVEAVTRLVGTYADSFTGRSIGHISGAEIDKLRSALRSVTGDGKGGAK